jgi:hypothetical protein
MQSEFGWGQAPWTVWVTEPAFSPEAVCTEQPVSGVVTPARCWTYRNSSLIINLSSPDVELYRTCSPRWRQFVKWVTISICAMFINGGYLREDRYSDLLRAGRPRGRSSSLGRGKNCDFQLHVFTIPKYRCVSVLSLEWPRLCVRICALLSPERFDATISFIGRCPANVGVPAPLPK